MPEHDINVMRGEVVEVTLNALVEQTINTPVSVAESLVMRIKAVASRMEAEQYVTPAVTATEVEYGFFTVTLSLRQGQTTLPGLETPGTLYSREIRQGFGEEATGVLITNPSHEAAMPAYLEFPNPGLTVATRVLSLYLQRSNGAGVLARAAFEIMYTLERVSTSALQAAQSLSETF